MFQREALSICFRTIGPYRKHVANESNDFSENYAVKIHARSINVLSGRQFGSEQKASSSNFQDFVVISGQQWLDGFYIGEGVVKQFVAMPLGRKYSVEQQLTGTEWIAGLQLEIAPRYKTDVVFAIRKAGSKCRYMSHEALDTPMDIFQTPVEAGLILGHAFFMHSSTPSYNLPSNDIKIDKKIVANMDFFGATLEHYRGSEQPTFVRELVAWIDRVEDDRCVLELVPPVTVPVYWQPWKGRSRVHGEGHRQTISLKLSPFIDVHYIGWESIRHVADE
jgi:hypothetical protein